MSRVKKNLKVKVKKSRKATGKKQKSKGSSWREFEKLVTRIEHVLAPKGAVVTSPDHLVDKTTGEKREVDASIKFKAGTTDIIITIECRERVSVQDSIWIEQLATKQLNIGVSKTIAVSSNGFTAPAIKKAKFYGIDTRKITNISEDSISGWTNLKLTRTQINYHIENFKFSLALPEEDQEKIYEDLKKHGGKLFDLQICTSYKSGTKVSMRQLLHDFQAKTREKIPDPEIPDVGNSGVFNLNAQFPPGQIFIETSFGKFDLIGLQVDFTLYKHEENTVKSSNSFTYSDSETDLVQGVEFEIVTSTGKKELLSIHKDIKSKITTATIWRDEHNKK